MTTPNEVGNGRAGLKRVVEDLQVEHTRFLARSANLDKHPLPAMEALMEKHRLSAQIEYLELLIRRYRGWLTE